MKKAIIFMFSGQGSQYYQMGHQLFSQEKEFKKWMLIGDEIVRSKIGISLVDTLYNLNNMNHKRFDQTLITHPAIFLVEYALGQLLISQGIKPDLTLGVSLGEYAAAVFAGGLYFEDALNLVIQQAEIITELCQPGGMLAIISPISVLNHINQTFTISAINSLNHFVISATFPALISIELELKSKGVVYQRLDVSHGFHSSLIEEAALPFSRVIENSPIHSLSIPLVSCCQTDIINSLSSQHFWNCVRLPINFVKIINSLEKEAQNIYLDVGPSGTLATLVKYNLPNYRHGKIISLLTPYSQNILNFAQISKLINI